MLTICSYRQLHLADPHDRIRWVGYMKNYHDGFVRKNKKHINTITIIITVESLH
jgi:hypothetical protein